MIGHEELQELLRSRRSVRRFTPRMPDGAQIESLLASVQGRRLHLDRDLLVGVECPMCRVKREVMKPVALATLREGKCGSCGAVMRTDIVHVVERGTPLAANQYDQRSPFPRTAQFSWFYPPVCRQSLRSASTRRRVAEENRSKKAAHVAPGWLRAVLTDVDLLTSRETRRNISERWPRFSLIT